MSTGKVEVQLEFLVAQGASGIGSRLPLDRLDRSWHLIADPTSTTNWGASL